MNPMTIKDIAELATSSETTIRRWTEKASAKMAGVRAKMAGAQETKKPAEFNLEEVIAIVRAGGNDTLADLLLANAKETATGKTAQAKLPNGKQMEQYRLMAEKGLITRDQLHTVLGIIPAATSTVHPRPQLPTPYRNPDAVESALRPLTLLSPTVTKNMLGAGYAAAKREEARQAQWAQNGKLFGDEARS